MIILFPVHILNSSTYYCYIPILFFRRSRHNYFEKNVEEVWGGKAFLPNSNPAVVPTHSALLPFSLIALVALIRFVLIL